MPANPLLYRKAPRDAVIAALATSFNANLFAFAEAYGGQYGPTSQFVAQTPFDIDFTGVAGNFAVANIEQFENSPITNFPALCVFTADARDQGDLKGFRWDGPVLVAARFCIRYRAGAEPALTTEDTVDWIDDAFISTINDPTIQWPAGVIYKRNSKIDRAARLEPLADGWQLIVEFAIPFTVAVSD